MRWLRPCALETGSAREVYELEWTERLARLLREVTPIERADHRQSPPWKVRLAVRMKTYTAASNRWLATQLHMPPRLPCQTRQPCPPPRFTVRPDPFRLAQRDPVGSTRDGQDVTHLSWALLDIEKRIDLYRCRILPTPAADPSQLLSCLSPRTAFL
jgi:hypothetical protein